MEDYSVSRFYSLHKELSCIANIAHDNTHFLMQLQESLALEVLPTTCVQ